jgi:hypothetical protein
MTFFHDKISPFLLAAERVNSLKFWVVRVDRIWYNFNEVARRLTLINEITIYQAWRFFVATEDVFASGGDPE